MGRDGPVPLLISMAIESIDTYPADDRGRIRLGPDYAERDVRVAVLDDERAGEILDDAFPDEHEDFSGWKEHAIEQPDGEEQAD